MSLEVHFLNSKRDPWHDSSQSALGGSLSNSRPWADLKSRSTLGFHNLYVLEYWSPELGGSILQYLILYHILYYIFYTIPYYTCQNWGFYFLEPFEDLG